MKHGSTRIRKAFFSVFHPSTQMSHFEQGISNAEVSELRNSTFLIRDWKFLFLLCRRANGTGVNGEHQKIA